ncbi:hypothetical protein [Shewanella aegiceratis]|uniref:hypothetical protein n=1 Tax=Shewanella aegiceratis TaxID=2864203 RepID=UPI001C6620B8|nr:hypothetical protein [Shewanella aegiceratis]QYJ81706.1 hypothetical protein K0H80_15590 [Shewanella aegiceratis]
MIKLIILGCFVAWMFIRKLSKSKPDSIWRLKLRRLARYLMIGAAAWFVVIAFGSVKYQIYTDKTFTYKSKVQTVFAWEENRLLPIKALAKPVLLSLDYQTSFPMSKATEKSLSQQFPYAPRFQGLSKFLGTLLLLVWLTAYLSRHRHTDKRWQEAVSTDTKAGYRDFLTWARSNPLRRAHCNGFIKKADVAMQSIDQRGRLKLEMYRKGWAERGLNAEFLDMLHKVIKTGHSQISVKATHMSCTKPVSDIDINLLVGGWSGLDPQYFMQRYYANRKARAEQKAEPDAFEAQLLKTPEHLRFTYPEPQVAGRIIEKQLASVLNQGKKRFLGDELVQFTPHSDIGFKQPEVSLEFTYMQSLNEQNGKRSSGVWTGELRHETITMGDTQYSGGNILWLVFGLVFEWRLVIDGVEAAKGEYKCFPDANICNVSRPSKQKMPEKAEIEKNIFDVVALSNISSLFAQMMGIKEAQINDHTIEFNNQTAFEVKRQTETSNQLAQKLEDALRGEALDELIKSSGEELYKQNKEMVDAMIRDYIVNHGDTDTVLMIIDLLGDAAPELAAGLLQIIGGSDE